MKKGKRYAELTKLVDRTNNYDPQEAVALVLALLRKQQLQNLMKP